METDSMNSGTSSSSGRRKSQKLKTQIVKDFEVSREKLGSGSYASVWKGWHRTKTDLLAAVKVISLSKISAGLRDKIDSEIQILKGQKHANIVQLYDVKKCEKYIILILEFCGGGDLSKAIKSCRSKTQKTAFKETVALYLMRQLAQGMHFLHNRNLVHRDIKPQNLLLSCADLEKAILKIADFGFARYLAVDPQNMDLAKTLCGSPVYMAPEILSKHKYNANVDLWSAGAVLYEMLFGEPPFRGDTLLDLQRNVEQGLCLPPPADDLEPSCKDLLERLLQGDPDDRITYNNFFHHPWLYKEGLYDPTPDGDGPSSPGRLSEGSPLSVGSQAGFPKSNSCSGSGLSLLISGQQGTGKSSASHGAGKSSASIETQTSPILDNLQAKAKISEAEIGAQLTAAKGLFAIALQLGEMAQQVTQEGYYYVEGYTLYEKSLSVCAEAQAKLANVPLNTPTLKQLSLQIRESFDTVLSRAFQVASFLKNRPAPGRCHTVEQLILAYTVENYGANGVVEELLGNISQACTMYEKGAALLQYIVTSLGPEDTVVMHKFIDAFGKRIKACKAAEEGHG
mmetsp:Transcript_2020/g.3987  ORF Transcript_2020/g.3987 Transcript_2020/m.3987 type:complete len:568 (-) Transcript_2020:438-2141(-)